MTSNKKLRARGRRDKPGSGPNYDKAHGLIPRQPDPPKKGKYPNSPAPLIELVVKWCKEHGYHRAIHAIKTETQKREATGGYTKPCSWDDASSRYPTLVELFDEWKKMHPEIPEWMPASEYHARYILPDALKKEEERKRKEEETKRKEERRKKDERGDFSDTSISEESEEESDEESDEGMDKKEAAAGAPITPTESDSAAEKKETNQVEGDDEDESESESEDDMPATASAKPTISAEAEESSSEEESESEAEDVAPEPKVKPQDVPLPDSESEAETDEESEADSDESEEETPAKTSSVAQTAEIKHVKAEGASESSGEEEEDEDNSSESDEKEVPKAEVKSDVNPLKRKTPASSDSENEEESEEESSEEEEENKPAVESKPTTDGLKRKAPESSSDEDDSSEEQSSSDEEPQAKKVKVGEPRGEDNDEDMRDANSAESSEEESDSGSEEDSEEEEKETRSVTKPEPKKLDSAIPPTKSANGNASDSSYTLHATSPQFVATDPMNAVLKKNTKPGNGKSTTSFSRIPTNQKIDPRFASNKYVNYDYAEKAHRDLSVTKGKGFTKEKNKKKRGAYKGGFIDTQSRAIKFDD